MKRLICIWLLPSLFFSCRNKDLCYDDHQEKGLINVVFHWEEGARKPTGGMMVNLIAGELSPKFGMEMMSANGGKLTLPYYATYRAFSYDYYAENIYFRNESDGEKIEAYCSPLIRSTYSKLFPDHTTISEPAFPFWVDRVKDFYVDGSDLDFYPENAVEIFTFEIRGVIGAEHITDTRGGISGMSASYFMYDGSLSNESCAVLFGAVKDGINKKITGSFRTFGHINKTNLFTIEILYPSKNGGIIQASWDVTDQVIHAKHIPGVPDIIIDNNEGKIPPIIPEGNEDGDGSGFEADVEEWENVVVPIPV